MISRTSTYHKNANWVNNWNLDYRSHLISYFYSCYRFSKFVLFLSSPLR